jgi:hypothetical protein
MVVRIRDLHQQRRALRKIGRRQLVQIPLRKTEVGVLRAEVADLKIEILADRFLYG